jgi:hypothetical protein
MAAVLKHSFSASHLHSPGIRFVFLNKGSAINDKEPFVHQMADACVSGINILALYLFDCP